MQALGLVQGGELDSVSPMWAAVSEGVNRGRAGHLPSAGSLPKRPQQPGPARLVLCTWNSSGWVAGVPLLAPPPHCLQGSTLADSFTQRRRQDLNPGAPIWALGVPSGVLPAAPHARPPRLLLSTAVRITSMPGEMCGTAEAALNVRTWACLPVSRLALCTLVEMAPMENPLHPSTTSLDV